ncbi:unnamed protein product [Brassicogethes aeneus]|uniref:DUF4817 domain-containing protein n=1 Tax=Brassicogethes aeneus TaxID=1431903 RepID=A0A9P0FI76_BRAAE|nr:unnamed protein product [Brassicogethes aeneus]
MDFLTVEEKIEMILIYREAGRNLDAVNIYAQRFPEKIRSRSSFHRTVKQFTTNWSVRPKKRLRPATVIGGNNEINESGSLNGEGRVRRLRILIVFVLVKRLVPRDPVAGLMCEPAHTSFLPPSPSPSPSTLSLANPFLLCYTLQLQVNCRFRPSSSTLEDISVDLHLKDQN